MIPAARVLSVRLEALRPQSQPACLLQWALGCIDSEARLIIKTLALATVTVTRTELIWHNYANVRTLPTFSAQGTYRGIL